MSPSSRRAVRSTRRLRSSSALVRRHGQSMLLGLPGELRNKIYQKVLLIEQPMLLRSRQGRTSVRSGLCAVSQQIHKEFAYNISQSPVVIGRVVDFDFHHIIRFIDGMSEAERDDFPKLTKQGSSKRQLLIELSVTALCPPIPTNLLVWLRRFLTPTHTTHDIDVQYCVRDMPSGWQIKLFTPASTYASAAMSPQGDCRSGVPGKLQSSRRNKEMEKIVSAFVDAETMSVGLDKV